MNRHSLTNGTQARFKNWPVCLSHQFSTRKEENLNHSFTPSPQWRDYFTLLQDNYGKTMGLSSPHYLLWKTVQLPFDMALQVVQNVSSKTREQKLREMTDADDDITINAATRPSRQRLKVVMDANLVGYKHLGNRSPFEPHTAVFHIAAAASDKLVDVEIGVDGPSRHPSKRATCKRKADEAKASIELTIARASLQTLLSSQEVESEAKHAEDIKNAQSRIVSLENQLKRRFPPDFADKLQGNSDQYSPEGKGEISFFVAPTQADPCLAKIMVDENADAIISDDSDFAMYIGANGVDIMIKEVRIKQNGDPITSCRLCTGQESIANLIEAYLNPKLGHSPFAKSKDDKRIDGNIPKYPVFSGVKDPMVRALVGMIVGCDACPGGVEGSGPAVASELLQKHAGKTGAALHDALASDILKMKGCTIKEKDAIMCLAESILFETTYGGGYIHGTSPAVLGKFLEDFKSEGTEIIDGPAIESCKGCMGTSHSFLAAEGVYDCVECNAKLCRFCHMVENVAEVPNGQDRVLCLECMGDSVVGGDGTDQQEMREFLSSKGVDVPVSATYMQVLKLFEDAESGALIILKMISRV